MGTVPGQGRHGQRGLQCLVRAREPCTRPGLDEAQETAPGQGPSDRELHQHSLHGPGSTVVSSWPLTTCGHPQAQGSTHLCSEV